jgi:hypothetical protein
LQHGPLQTTVRDTRDVLASYFLPQDRACVLALLADLLKPAPDEAARSDVANQSSFIV